MRRLILCCLLCLFALPAAAQETDLVPTDVTVSLQVDSFGVERSMAEGMLLNQGKQAYENVDLLADAFDSEGTQVGEGMGYLERACGEALLDYALQPGAQAPFSVPLDTYEDGVEIDHVTVSAEGSPAAPTAAPAEIEGIRRVSDAEVVELQWLDENSLIYSPGCYRDVFTNRPWFAYHLDTGESTPTEHPRASDVTPEMLRTLELSDPAIYNRSFLSFAPGQRRAVYQSELNTLFSAEPDGSFKRLLYDALFNITLQGINWHKNSGTLLAYYHGGYGDDVLYLVANADGRQFSQHPTLAIPSQIVPGFAANGRGVVIYTTIDGVSGYYLKVASNDFTILMFEADAPGNNWPAPFYEITPDNQRWIFIARPVDGEARLQCFNPDSKQLHDYTALPLDLATDERAWMWLSPEDHTLALAANGLHSGLWLVDLTQFEACD